MSGAKEPLWDRIKEAASILRSALPVAAKPRYARGGVVPTRQPRVIEAPDNIRTLRPLPPPLQGLEYKNLTMRAETYIQAGQTCTVTIYEDGTLGVRPQ